MTLGEGPGEKVSHLNPSGQALQNPSLTVGMDVSGTLVICYHYHYPCKDCLEQ